MMKKFLLLFALCTTCIFSYAESEYIYFYNDSIINGHITESSWKGVTIIADGDSVARFYESYNIMLAYLGDGKYLTSSHDGFLEPINREYMAKSLNHFADIAEHKSDPMADIAKALKTSGSVAMGIGVPALAAGIATCIAGNITGSNQRIIAGKSYNIKEINGCVEASYYLLGAGAALTLVGIPLYVCGNKLLFYYSGTRLSVSYNF